MDPVAGAADPYSALRALVLLARLHHVPADAESLAHRLNLSPQQPVGTDELLLAARELGLKARRVASPVDRLPLAPLPALALMKDGSVCVLAQCDGARVLLQRFDPEDPDMARPRIEPLAAFVESWSGQLLLVTSRASLAGELAKFDFSWFVPSLVRHRRLLGEVLLV